MALTTVTWQDLDADARQRLLQRPAVRTGDALTGEVRQIIDDVRARGDLALSELTERFDSARIGAFEVDAGEFAAAEHEISRASCEAIDLAIRNVSRFHGAQRAAGIDIETMPGVRCQRLSRPIDAVGMYVPAGSAPLPSTAIMLAVPATIAACPERIVCTPPRPDGTADPGVLVAARRSGATRVFKVGGAQAIAALAYGTGTIPRVDKIFGPGNARVTAAKVAVAADPGGAAIDLPAGPSEVMVIGDESAHAGFVAADLLSQAEHGADSQTIFLSTSAASIDRVLECLAEQSQRYSRSSIIGRALCNGSAILVPDLATAIEICNTYAPEHLILQIVNARGALEQVRNAGSVFLGPWTPESAGDYCSGTNHVLPTYGAARALSGLGLDQFLRFMTVQELTRDGLSALSGAVRTLAGMEGLEAHANAVTVRLSEIAREADAA